MGAVCAVVYLLALIFFIPFAFYKDIVAATSGGGNRDVVLETQHVETGRYLHRFPHGRVGTDSPYKKCAGRLTIEQNSSLPTYPGFSRYNAL